MSAKLDGVFHTAFLVAFSWRTEFGYKPIVGLEGKEGLLKLPGTAFEDSAHSWCEIVKPEMCEHSTEKLEGLDRLAMRCALGSENVPDQ